MLQEIVDGAASRNLMVTASDLYALPQTFKERWSSQRAQRLLKGILSSCFMFLIDFIVPTDSETTVIQQVKAQHIFHQITTIISLQSSLFQFWFGEAFLKSFECNIPINFGCSHRANRILGVSPTIVLYGSLPQTYKVKSSQCAMRLLKGISVSFLRLLTVFQCSNWKDLSGQAGQCREHITADYLRNNAFRELLQFWFCKASNRFKCNTLINFGCILHNKNTWHHIVHMNGSTLSGVNFMMSPINFLQEWMGSKKKLT